MKQILIATGVLLVSAAGLLLLGQAPALPGTSADRIGFPTNYKTTYKQLYAIDNTQNQQVRVIWANDIAQTVDPKQPWNFPYGSILLFEDYPTIPDENGNPTLDAKGRFLRGDLRTIFAMKKDKGFGTEYGPIRNGEWEYVSYRPDGTFATAPAASGSCALCHMQGTSAALTNNLPPINAKNDYVFRTQNFFTGATGAMPDGVMLNYLFVPRTIHVKAGVPLTPSVKSSCVDFPPPSPLPSAPTCSSTSATHRNTSPPSALAKVYGAIALALDHPREMDARISQHESTSGMGRASRTHSTSRRTTLSILVKMANMAMEGTIRCPRDVS